MLEDDKTRSLALRRFRDLCFSGDSFATKIEVRQVVLEGLIQAEDTLEQTRGAKATERRKSIATIRRRLEVELWP